MNKTQAAMILLAHDAAERKGMEFTPGITPTRKDVAEARRALRPKRTLDSAQARAMAARRVELRQPGHAWRAGRPPKPTRCPKCDALCPSYTLARAHRCTTSVPAYRRSPGNPKIRKRGALTAQKFKR